MKKQINITESKIFKSWKALVPSLTEREFCEAVAWVCDDPAQGKLTREIGLTKGGIVRLTRHNIADGRTEIRYEDGRLWTGDTFRVPCAKPDFADADGMIAQSYKLSLSKRDRI